MLARFENGKCIIHSPNLLELLNTFINDVLDLFSHNFREKIATAERKSPLFVIVSIPAKKRMSRKKTKKPKINIISIFIKVKNQEIYLVIISILVIIIIYGRLLAFWKRPHLSPVLI